MFDGSPVVSDGSQVVSDGSPVVSDGSPVVSDGSRVVTDGSWVVSDGSPLKCSHLHWPILPPHCERYPRVFPPLTGSLEPPAAVTKGITTISD